MTHSGVQTQRRWVFGPASDLLLGCGLAYVLVFGVHAAVGESLQSAVPMWALIVGTLLLSGPHYGATLLRVYEQRHDRREYALFAVWASAAILGVFVWGLYDYAVGSLLIMLYLSWSPWHYSGQNYGITRMFLHRRGVEVTPLARRLLRASFILSFLLALFAFHGLGPSASYAPNPGESYLSGYVYGSASLGIPDPWQDAALVLIAVAYLGTLGSALVLLLRRASVATLAPALVLVGAQGIWFSLPALARNWGLLDGVEPLSTRHVQYSFLWIAMAHAVQYLWITAYYARQSGRSRHYSVFYLKALAAGTLIWTVPALVFAPQLLGRLPYDLGLGLMVASAVNLHHFVLDGAIWKLRNTRVAGVLLRRPEPTSGDLAPARTRWWPVVATAGALCVALNLAIGYEVEFGLRRPMKRDDSARYELATQRLARVGRDSTTFHFTAGNRARARGDVEAARGHYRAGLAFHPTWETALVLSQLERRQGDLEASLRALETAHRVAPENARVLYHYGATLLRVGAVERARVLLREAVTRDPDDADYRRALELAEQRTGR